MLENLPGVWGIGNEPQGRDVARLDGGEEVLVLIE